MNITPDMGLPNPENQSTQERYAFWLRIEHALGDGQQIAYQGKSLTMADAAWVTARRKEYEALWLNEQRRTSGKPSLSPVSIG